MPYSIERLRSIVLIVVALIALGAFLTAIAQAGELYTYKVYGENLQTGMTVAGRAWEQDKNGNLRAKIWDELEVKEMCFGAWIGRGLAQVGCNNGHQYRLVVVEGEK